MTDDVIKKLHGLVLLINFPLDIVGLHFVADDEDFAHLSDAAFFFRIDEWFLVLVLLFVFEVEIGGKLGVEYLSADCRLVFVWDLEHLDIFIHLLFARRYINNFNILMQICLEPHFKLKKRNKNKSMHSMIDISRGKKKNCCVTNKKLNSIFWLIIIHVPLHKFECWPLSSTFLAIFPSIAFSISSILPYYFPFSFSSCWASSIVKVTSFALW